MVGFEVGEFVGVVDDEQAGFMEVCQGAEQYLEALGDVHTLVEGQTEGRRQQQECAGDAFFAQYPGQVLIIIGVGLVVFGG